MTPFNLVKEVNLNLGTDFKSPGEMKAYARIASDRLGLKHFNFTPGVYDV